MERKQILAYRLSRHHLLSPLPSARIVDAASMGIQNTVPGSAVVALGIRLRDFKAEDFTAALQKKKTLVEAISLRGASFILPARDFVLFTQGIYPDNEKDLMQLVGPARSSLKKHGISATDAIRQVTAVMRKVLKGRALSQNEIHAEWRKHLPKSLLPWCRPCESHHVQYSVVAAASQQGVCCMGPLRNGESDYVLADQWLPSTLVSRGKASLRPSELVERYLHYYGPSTVEGFAGWAGLSSSHALKLWKLAQPHLSEVSVEKKSRTILKKDLRALESPPSSRGVILLPPKDPFLDQRDRELFVPDRKLHPKIWRILGYPGVLILDGEVRATWKAQRNGQTLRLQFEKLGVISGAARGEAEARAAQIAILRQSAAVEVKWG